MESSGAQKSDSGFDVVFCDLKMPGIGGHGLFEASKSVCGEGNGPAFVFMTGDVADPETQEFLRTAGADPDRVLLKPFRIASLMTVMDHALKVRQGSGSMD